MKKIKQYTNDGETLGEILKNAKIGDVLELAGLAFGMRHDKFKIGKLKLKYYKIESIDLNYTKDSMYMLVKDSEGTLFSIIGNQESKTGLKIFSK